MEKLDHLNKLDKTAGQSMDIVADNIAKLKELFPEILAENKIDFKALQSLLGEEVEVEDERYSFKWHGKAQAHRLAQSPSTGTLRPCPEDSVDWDNSKNIFIEGDNLEVLKLLQKSYHKQVKMIYIDPPYNTGSDFVYPDDFKDNIQNYKKISGQVDSDNRPIISNPETSGRYHTDWLNMLYPRLKLARNLLRDDGVIFISIDDNEVRNLRNICDEIFGENNFVETLVWKRRATPPNDRIVGKNHEYVLIYSRSIDSLILHLQPRSEELNGRYSNPDNDPLGHWVASDLSANGKGGRLTESCVFPIENPILKQLFHPPQNKCWLYNKDKIDQFLLEGRIGFRANTGTPFLKRYLSEVRQGSTLPTILDSHGYSQDSAKETREIFESDVFDFPKPIKFLQTIITTGSAKDDLILDFFSGSSTTAQAIMSLNAEEDSKRRYIMVQLPEPIDLNNKEQKIAAEFCMQIKKPQNIAEISKERLRRVTKKIKEENPEYKGDLGFKVFKLDSSNLKPWDADFDSLAQDLAEATEVVKADRKPEDVLFEILLKYGLDLTLPIDTLTIAGKTVYEVGAGALIVCLDDGVTEAVAEGIGKLKEQLAPEVMRVVFKDSSFASDAAKVNAVQVLKQYGIDDVKSI